MARTLVLALPETGWKTAQACEHVLSPDGRSPGSHGRSAPGALPAADGVIVLAPPGVLSWHRVRLPPLPARRVPAALAGLLEDRLLDDPAQLAFALAPTTMEDGTRLVAVCDRSWLQGVLDGCAERRLRLLRVAPAHAPAADEAGRRLLVLGGADDPQVVRVEREHVLSLPLEQAAVLWPATEPAGPALPLLAEGSLRTQAEAALGRAASPWPASQALWQAAQSGWDLLQFDLADARRRPGLKRLGRAWQAAWREPRWRPARWGLVLLLLAQVAGLNAWAWRLQSELGDRREQARAVLQQAFPGVRSVVDAPLQMERELALLRRARGVPAAGDADALLAAASAALPAAEGLQSLRYANGELSLNGVQLDAAAWEQARTHLAEQGYRAERVGNRVQLRAEARP